MPTPMYLNEDYIINLIRNRQKSIRSNLETSLPPETVLLKLKSFYQDILPKIKGLYLSNTIIHGDVRGSNFLIDENEKIKIIDWELVRIGDKYWDVSGGLFVFLEFTSNTGSDESSCECTVNTNTVQKFWQNYHQENDLSKISEDLVIKVIYFLLLRALEECLNKIALGENPQNLEMVLDAFKNPNGYYIGCINIHSALTLTITENHE